MEIGAAYPMTSVAEWLDMTAIASFDVPAGMQVHIRVIMEPGLDTEAPMVTYNWPPMVQKVSKELHLSK
jgi:hypothetical protein